MAIDRAGAGDRGGAGRRLCHRSTGSNRINARPGNGRCKPRAETLNASALQPGRALACLDAVAGESTEAACEAKVFASPQSTAAAVAYTGAQLTLLADAQKFDPGLRRQLRRPPPRH